MPTDHTRKQFERAVAGAGDQRVELRLFVAGMGPRSTQAVSDLQRLCAKYGDHCHVEIVDIYEQPAMAAQEQIVAVPTLARVQPLPLRRVIGAIGNIDHVANNLGIRVNQAAAAT
jgi:thioredoxin-like negative regulator of GroEL